MILDQSSRHEHNRAQLERAKEKIWWEHYEQPDYLLQLAHRALASAGLIPKADCDCADCSPRRTTYQAPPMGI